MTDLMALARYESFVSAHVAGRLAEAREQLERPQHAEARQYLQLLLARSVERGDPRGEPLRDELRRLIGT